LAMTWLVFISLIVFVRLLHKQSSLDCGVANEKQ
jgi:hypothetical protein